jgi:hypothetical protein
VSASVNAIVPFLVVEKEELLRKPLKIKTKPISSDSESIDGDYCGQEANSFKSLAEFK